MLSENSVGVGDVVDGGDAVLTEQDELSVGLFRELIESADFVIDLAGGASTLFVVGPEALEVIIKMRQVDEGEVGV